MPLQETSGAASYDAFGGGVAAVPNYIEDVFSTWLYTGNGSTLTITNGIDLAGKGGLTWIKSRSNANNNILNDTARPGSFLVSNLTNAQAAGSTFSSFTESGFILNGSIATVNASGTNYASWSFRKQPKFFDVVTWTGDGANRTIAHNLGSVPGCIMVKRTDATGDWQVYHGSLANTEYLVLNSSAGKATGATRWNSTTPTSTVFSLGTDATVNANGGTYVAYIYASNAGGFGLDGTDNVITCGSFTAPSTNSSFSVNLGYEPQWILFKDSNNTADAWYVADSMRGFNLINATYLTPNNSNSERTFTFPYWIPTATGFTNQNSAAAVFNPGNTIIYIAIRRGPMRVPTTGTSVLGINARTGTSANATVTGSAGVSDAVLIKNRGSAVGDLFASRLTGTGYLETSDSAAEVAAGTTILQANPWDVMDGVKVGTTSTRTNASSNTFINYLFDRAPGFMDIVCYTGTGVNRTVAHNLAAVPELMIVKNRSVVGNWNVYTATTGNTSFLELNTNYQQTTNANTWNNTSPTSSVFTVGTSSATNGSGNNLVAYLFATCAGVSKVGSYTGTGTTQTINCGFTSGARFVLIKRVNLDNFDWYVWDSARGIVSGNDPYFLLNTTAAEVTNTDFIDTAASGFEISSTAPAAINASGGTFIFLAIA